MSRFVRLLPQLSGSRRSYSFFSSKPGGGGSRYFNSAKPTKVIATATTTKAGASASKATTAVPPTNATADGNGSNAALESVEVGEETASSSSSTPAPSAAGTEGVAPSASGAAPGRTGYHQTSPLDLYSPSSFPLHPNHPALKPHEFKLHHFFSLHRPYLLMHQPVAKLFESHPVPVLSDSAAPLNTSTSASKGVPASLGTIDDPPEASPEADADAARLLSRALVVNHLGSAVDWEVTLQRLGLSDAVSSDALSAEAIEGVVVDMDSTKRKRRRKMKKHKLKKRRRLSRASRLRLGK